jgi:hypothetical protein
MTGGCNAEKQIFSDETHNRFHANENNTANSISDCQLPIAKF